MFKLVLRDERGQDKALIASIWLMAILSTVVLGGKVFARYRRFKQLYWDDFWVIFAWANAIPLAVANHMSINHGKLLSVGETNVFLSRPIGQFFFYNALWAVKVSFLIFFKRLIPTSMRRLRNYWIVALTINIMAYIGVWGVNPYKCWAQKGLTLCERDPGVIKGRPISFSVATGLITLTDILILVIPFVILSNIRQLQRKKKVILYALFSLEVITIIVSIVRCVIGTRGMIKDKDFQLKWLGWLVHIEAEIAIIVACIGSLRSLFTHDDSTRRSAYPRSNEPSSRANKKSFPSPLSTARIQLQSFKSRSQDQRDSMELPLSQPPQPPPKHSSDMPK
ncbi:unnamed protein product [Periconia digitata]|uniref:Rhodopsin domain-containing protein n=1 Tax=Periconia digitata TaxID=1303443 RepID=A0A9W4XNH6_9PLEO|nr:unnamed protein product [Periconia digitata]